MSHDIDLTIDNDPVYASMIVSAGVVRIAIGKRDHLGRVLDTQLSEPVPHAALKDIKQTLDILLNEDEEK